MHVVDSGLPDVMPRVRRGHSLGAVLLGIAAERSGATVDAVDGRLGVVEHEGRRILLEGPFCTETVTPARIVHDKVMTKTHLRQSSVRTPIGGLARSADEAVRLVRSIPGTVVVKPRRGRDAQGVTVDVSSPADVRAAYRFARQYGEQVLIEQYIDAEREIRVFSSVSGAYAAVQLILPAVTGDGESTVRELIAAKNRQRDENPASFRQHITTSGTTKDFLARQELTLKSVPEDGDIVTVHNVGGMRIGGDSEQCLESLPEHVQRTATDSVAAVPGLAWSAVDILIERGTGKPYVIELNSGAEFGGATYPVSGEPRHLAEDMWRDMFSTAPSSLQSPAQGPPVHPSPQEIPLPAKTPRAGVTVQSLLQHYAARYHLPTESTGLRLLALTAGDDRKSLFAANGASEKDLMSVSRAIRDFSSQRKLLIHGRVPRSRGRRVWKLQQIADLLDASRAIQLIPAHKPWDSRRRILAKGFDALTTDLFAQHKEWFALVPASRRRLRVFLTGAEVFALTASGRAGAFTQAEADAAVDVARQALHAVPGLRWAAVDVYVQGTERRATASVGGITFNPRVSTQDRLVSGDLDRLCEWLTGSAA